MTAQITRRIFVGLMIVGILSSGGCAKIGLGRKAAAGGTQKVETPKLATSVYTLGVLPARTNQAPSGLTPTTTVPQNITEVVTPSYKLKSGDPILVYLRGIPPQDQELQDIIDEEGNLNLPFIGTIEARGKTSSQLENTIEQAYLSKQIYKNITVNVVMPSQSYFVRGEVRQAGRFPLITGVSVVLAITSAGGYSEFANSTSVKLIRGEKVTTVNAKDFERHPERDQYVEPGDVIVVPRSIF